MDKRQTSILFRCDASPEVGSGHMMRCLTLSVQLYRNGFAIIFLSNEGGLNVVNQFAEVPIKIINRINSLDECEQIKLAAKENNCRYLIWDSYDITQTGLDTVSADIPTMVIDDVYLLTYYNCDAVLNQNLFADHSQYKCKQGLTVLAGPPFALLREPFAVYHQSKKTIVKQAQKVLLTFGGSDVENNTLRVCEWLQNFTDFSLTIDLVMGTHFLYSFELKHFIKGERTHKLKLHQNVRDMAELLWNQDVVICAGGSTINELACLGVPACAVVTADNQRSVIDKASKLGIVMSLGEHSELCRENFLECFKMLVNSYQNRKSMSAAGRANVDGLGAKRVAEYITGKVKINC